mmetsp:Transcript_75750/g.148676  ORF Transcript_75750/g.148676 Transcript_75750/m.148676 type:complete len:119 (-) Transcript_75750:150-506(-)
MGDELTLKLIFANNTNSAEIKTGLNTTVRDVKAMILSDHWPADFTNIQSVARIRLFAAGRELGGKGAEDAKLMKDYRLPPGQAQPTPVHVMPVLKSAEHSAWEHEAATQSTQCPCAIL